VTRVLAEAAIRGIGWNSSRWSRAARAGVLLTVTGTVVSTFLYEV
jgi:hypothetical protein